MKTLSIPEAKSNKKEIKEPVIWTSLEKFSFRALFIYLIQLLIPFNSQFYKRLFNFDWANMTWQKLGGLATNFGAPEYIEVSGIDIWGIKSYINLGIALLIAIVIAGIWSLADRKTKHYQDLYYWILVIARYRIAFGIIAWGYKKLIPMQMEPPSIGILNTPYIDLGHQKLYWQAVGIVPGYEIFLGFAEVLAGIFLLFRRTTALGAALVLAILGNIVIANHVYDGMVHVHSFNFALVAFFILWKYLPAIYKLIILKKDVISNHYAPSFNKQWQKIGRTGLKVASWSIFVFFLFYLQSTDPVGYRYPHDYPGLANSAGYYKVEEFWKNGQLIPYSPLDSVRWQDVVFEKWTTMSIKINREQQVDIENTGDEGTTALEKRFEFRGIGGQRHPFNYEADTVNKVLHLVHKNVAHRDQEMILKYNRPDAETFILEGLNEFKDSIRVVLKQVKKNYVIESGIASLRANKTNKTR